MNESHLTKRRGETDLGNENGLSLSKKSRHRNGSKRRIFTSNMSTTRMSSLWRLLARALAIAAAFYVYQGMQTLHREHCSRNLLSAVMFGSSDICTYMDQFMRTIEKSCGLIVRSAFVWMVYVIYNAINVSLLTSGQDGGRGNHTQKKQQKKGIVDVNAKWREVQQQPQKTAPGRRRRDRDCDAYNTESRSYYGKFRGLLRGEAAPPPPADDNGNGE